MSATPHQCDPEVREGRRDAARRILKSSRAKVERERALVAIDLGMALGMGREAMARACTGFVSLDCAISELLWAVNELMADDDE